jgi:hypothetical protein
MIANYKFAAEGFNYVMDILNGYNFKVSPISASVCIFLIKKCLLKGVADIR